MTCLHHRPLTIFLLGILLPLCSMPGYADSASHIYSQGKTAEAHGDYDAAFSYYQKAFQREPNEIKYKEAYEKSRFTAASQHVHKGEKLREENRLTASLVEFFRALEIDPGSEIAQQNIRQTKEAIDKLYNKGKNTAKTIATSKADAPAELALTESEPITLHMTAASNVIYQTLGKTAGINVIIDPEYPAKQITIDLQDVTLPEALRIVSDVSNSFWKPVTHNTIFVTQNTRAKRQEVDDQAIQIFYLSNISQPNDLNDIQTALRNVIATAKMYAIPSQNAIVVHGTPDEIFIAQRMITGLDKPKPEVMVDVCVMEVRRDKLRNIGLSPPTSFSASPSSSATLNEIGRTSAYSFSAGEATAELLMTDSDTRVLQNPKVRALDGQKATLKIGERIPIATGSYTTSSVSTAVQTQFQYIDVGVNIDLTPTIHDDRDVTLKLSVEVSSESGTTTIDSVTEPIISQQKTEQVIRLKDGEVSILAGLLSKQTSNSVSGTPGLGEIPLLKYFFSTQKHEVIDDEIVFMLTPHVVRATETDDESTREISTGSGGTIRVNRISTIPGSTVNLPPETSTGSSGNQQNTAPQK